MSRASYTDELGDLSKRKPLPVYAGHLEFRLI